MWCFRGGSAAGKQGGRGTGTCISWNPTPGFEAQLYDPSGMEGEDSLDYL